MIHLRPSIEVQDRIFWHPISHASTRRGIGASCFLLNFPRGLAGVICVALVLLGTACGGTSALASAAQTSPAPTANPSPGRWEIMGVLNARPLTSKEGWKVIQIDIVLENKTYAFRAPTIKTTGARVYTDASTFFEAKTFRTTGLTFVPADEIKFSAKIPHGYRMKGEYLNDVVVSYCFTATIPYTAAPKFVRIPGYDGDIVVYTNPSLVFPRDLNDVPLRTPDSPPMEIPGKATLTVSAFDRKHWWPTIYHRISATITLTSTLALSNTKVSLHFLPLGDDGIVGAPFNDTSDCQTKLELVPLQKETSRICAIIPHQAKNIHMIFFGDLNEVFDTKTPPPTP